MRIDDLTSIGEELTEEHLRLVSGAANKKAPGGKGNDGTSTSCGTMVIHGPTDANWTEADGDED
jgi:hypothetical protein